MKNERLSILIVDNTENARDELRSCLKSMNNILSVHEAISVDEALLKIINLSPDLIFLDALMNGKTGFDLVTILHKCHIFKDIVLMSNDKDHAVQAIKSGIYDFILKPVTVESLRMVIDKYLIRKRQKNDKQKRIHTILRNLYDGRKIKISSINNDVLISPCDILYCQAQGAYTVLFFENGDRHCVSLYLGQLEKMISGYHFYRISRSLLINRDKLFRVDKGDNSCTLIATNEKEVKLYGTRKQIHLLCAG